MKKLFVLILVFAFNGLTGLAQHSWVVKAGIHASIQLQQNVPGMLRSGYLDGGSSGGYQRMVFSGLVARDWQLTSRIGLQAGLGYRQLGFLSVARYQQTKGYSVSLPDDATEDNLFHYASSELSIQFRTAPKRTVGYLRLGGRLDYLVKFRSKFWGDHYGYLKRVDYHAFAAIGVEYALKKKWFKQNKAIDQLYSRPTALFIEFEAAPPLYNIDKDSASIPFAQITDQKGNVLLSTPFRLRKIIQNYSAGIVVGVRF